MRFWDSSAIIPLIVIEQNTETIKKIVHEDEDMVVWWATRVECRSALARRKREGSINLSAEPNALSILNALESVWSEVVPSEKIRNRTERLLSLHPLSTADAFQLAAALLWALEEPKNHGIVCLDTRVRAAASAEGFTVFPRRT